MNPPAGEGSDEATFGTSDESIQPKDMGLGQVVAFEFLISVSGSTSPENGVIDFVTDFATETSSGGAFGFDSNFGVYCAFVDPSDAANVGLDGDEKVTSFSTGTSGTDIRGTVRVEGLDDGDKVVVEVWVVLQDEISSGVTGNVQTRLASAATASNDSISTGAQTIPLSKVKNFFGNPQANADVSVQKSDSPDPVDLLGTLGYRIEVTNLSSDTVANDVTLSDTLDALTIFQSLTVTDSEGAPTTCSHDGSGQGGDISCDLGFLNPLETVVIEVSVLVDQNAPVGPGGSAPCDGSESLCNTVSITSLNDTEPSNNSTSQPTGVSLPGPFGMLMLDKVPMPIWMSPEM